ncbi:hypothetical protein [Haloarcula onubensis]|uniref:DUF6788 domain-containing protein n=1 Tax=Haloarcula onubensis TaxID=2950539 RepID=A0ABU2FV61_9EURY|nr:hypothetical protein [Halomicroarcula sp. S3CR25-11]MDS0284656.1 hypothetical protein [Halomicroarcula sp. S3CR25-11]
MNDDSHAERARDHLHRIDTQDDAELDALRTTAVDAVDALVADLADDETESVATETPESWGDSEWADKLEDAREKAGLSGSTGTLTTKTIDGRDYYYLQWREGEQVKSQYVSPVDPA